MKDEQEVFKVHPHWGRELALSMSNQVFSTGSRVHVTSYSPFRGLRGTIQTVNAIPHHEVDEPFCFYRIELEGAHIKEPIWFEHDEVEMVSP